MKEGISEREIMALLLFPVSVLPAAVEEKADVLVQPCPDAVTGLGCLQCSRESGTPRSPFWHSQAASLGTHSLCVCISKAAEQAVDIPVTNLSEEEEDQGTFVAWQDPAAAASGRAGSCLPCTGQESAHQPSPLQGHCQFGSISLRGSHARVSFCQSAKLHNLK